jgi:hypothetical protein
MRTTRPAQPANPCDLMRLSPQSRRYCTHRFARALCALSPILGTAVLAACAADMPVTAGALRRGLEHDLRIAEAAGDRTPIRWLGVATDGTIALARENAAALHYFDVGGNHVGTVAEERFGTDAFGQPIRGGWVGDTMWVVDELQRIAFLGRDGRVVRTLPRIPSATPTAAAADRLPVFHFVFPYAVYPGDTVLAVAQGAAGDPLADAIRGTALVRMSADGVVDRIVLETPPNDGALTVRIGQGSAVVHVPFYPRPHWAVSPDGSRLATVTTDVRGPNAGTYHVTAYTAAGEQIFSRSIPFDGVELATAVADSALQAQRAALPELSDGLEADVRSRIPPVYPPVEDLVVGADGRTWIGLRPTAAGRPWLILGEDGEQQGEVLLPPHVALEVAGATHLWGLERDAIDAQRVVRFRILEDGTAR